LAVVVVTALVTPTKLLYVKPS